MSKYGYKIWVLRADNEGHCKACSGEMEQDPNKTTAKKRVGLFNYYCPST
jgi:hypothetical protein